MFNPEAISKKLAALEEASANIDAALMRMNVAKDIDAAIACIDVIGTTASALVKTLVAEVSAMLGETQATESTEP